MMMMMMMISPEISNPIHESYSLIDAKLLYHKLLVGGWANPSEKYESQLGWWNSQYMEK